ncbi:MAG: PHB depolymerase family esterase [Negativicutes bacterium]|nr:PHB depolymerase family esterase [Negativicutes bacterium]
MLRWMRTPLLLLFMALMVFSLMGIGMKAQAAELAGTKQSKVFSGAIGERSWYEYRSSKYVPGAGTNLIIVLGDNGQSGKDAAMGSDWLKIAEQDGGVVIFPDSAKGVWSPDDTAFLRELYAFCTSNTYSIAGASRYIVGMGAGGKLAAEWAAQDTGRFAALATVDAPAADLRALKLANLPLPVLMLNANGAFDTALVSYFKAANGTNKGDVYKTELKYFKRGSAPWNDDFSKTNYIRLVTKATGGAEASRLVWNELFNTVRRWATIEGEGTLRVKRLAADMGMVKVVEEDGINHRSREAFVYIPSQVKNGTITTPVPIVMLFHGVTANGEYHADQTEWWKVAEKYNFILYSPTGINNRWEVGNYGSGIKDPEYFAQRIDDFASEGITVAGKQYKIDGSRVYLTGFSNGCMLSNTMAMKYPEKIAAIAAFSAPVDPQKVADPAKAKPVPVWLGLGDKDGFIATRSFDKGMQAMFDYWKNLAGTDPGEVPVVKTSSMLGVADNVVTKIYKSGSVELRFSDEKNIIHGMLNELPEKLWVEFLSNYKKEDGVSVDLRIKLMNIHNTEQDAGNIAK